MPTDAGFAITELAGLAGVTPRTIRYYISVGLLPAPEQSGRAARYGDDHLRRLRLVKRLQDQHLPLAEIRARLAELSDDEVVTALEAPEPGPVGSALDYIRSITAPTALSFRGVAEPSGPYSEDVAAPATARSLPAPMPSPQVRPVAAMWERIPLAPDVELHVRRPLSRTANRRVERLVTIAREILEDQP